MAIETASGVCVSAYGRCLTLLIVFEPFYLLQSSSSLPSPPLDMVKSSNKMVPDYTAWLLAARHDLINKLGQHGAANYLDCHLECLREALKEAYTCCQTPVEEEDLFVMAIDSLTTLRLASLSSPEWVATGYARRHLLYCGLTLPMMTERNIKVMHYVLDFLLLHPISADMKPLCWDRIREWLLLYTRRSGPKGLDVLD